MKTFHVLCVLCVSVAVGSARADFVTDSFGPKDCSKPGTMTLVHTEVPEALGGRGVGSTLVRGALEAIRRKGLKGVAKCPFVAGWMGKHPEFGDLVG